MLFPFYQYDPDTSRPLKNGLLDSGNLPELISLLFINFFH